MASVLRVWSPLRLPCLHVKWRRNSLPKVDNLEPGGVSQVYFEHWFESFINFWFKVTFMPGWSGPRLCQPWRQCTRLVMLFGKMIRPPSIAPEMPFMPVRHLPRGFPMTSRQQSAVTSGQSSRYLLENIYSHIYVHLERSTESAVATLCHWELTDKSMFSCRFGESSSTRLRGRTQGQRLSSGQRLWPPGGRWTWTRPCSARWWSPSLLGSWLSSIVGGVKSPTSITNLWRSINRSWKKLYDRKF